MGWALSQTAENEQSNSGEHERDFKQQIYKYINMSGIWYREQHKSAQ